VRYCVDPAELQTAAAIVAKAGDRARTARDDLGRVSEAVPSWCPDPNAAAAVLAAIDAIELHATRAGRGTEAVARCLIASAEGYRAADGQAPR